MGSCSICHMGCYGMWFSSFGIVLLAVVPSLILFFFFVPLVCAGSGSGEGDGRDEERRGKRRLSEAGGKEKNDGMTTVGLLLGMQARCAVESGSRGGKKKENAD